MVGVDHAARHSSDLPQSMSAIVIGASGQVGRNLLDALRVTGREVYGTSWRHPSPDLLTLDLRDAKAVEACVRRLRVNVVYLSAALSNVDRCEAHPDESNAINVAPVKGLASMGVRIVFFSSDYVFAGASGPYCESDEVQPLSVYGKHKVLAERELPDDALVVRTTVVYGADPQRMNFVCRLVDGLRASKPFHVPVDQVGSPTYASNLAQAVVYLEHHGACGTYNVSGPTRVSRYEFAQEVARVFRLDGNLVRPTTTAEIGQVAPRPLNAGLVSKKAQSLLPFALLDYRAGVRRFYEETVAADGL